MIIDANTHPTPDGRWFGLSLDASADCLLRGMDEAGVEKSLLVPFEGIIPNSFPEELAARLPDRFLPAASFNPARHPTPEAAAEAFDAELSSSTARVIKLHSRLHNYSLTDERVTAMLNANARRQRPFHIFICGYIFNGKTIEPYSPPLLFYNIAVLFPQTQFVVMHLGGSWLLQLSEAIRPCANVHLDLSFALGRYKGTSLAQDISYLCRTFDRRLIFGSDFPECSPANALRDFRSLTEDLPAEKADAILGGNLSRLLA